MSTICIKCGSELVFNKTHSTVNDAVFECETCIHEIETLESTIENLEEEIKDKIDQIERLEAESIR